MADVAHDASGPASPKPGDIAPQQASRPDSPDKGKLRVFISYSREDLDFADQLAAALDSSGCECFIDREGISGGEAWKRRLGNLISEADTVVFVLSPDSARSETCKWEVEEAARLNKRILPANWRPLESVSPPPRLRDLNYIFFYKEPKVPGSGFGTGLANLVAALNTDFDWLREHTRYLQRATEWDRGGRPANRLLSGEDIAEAKAWAARRSKSAPEPTSLHLDFIRASEEEAEARSSAQRKQLEAMAAAQAERETALRQAEEAQRKRATTARIRNIALVAVSIFALLAGWLGWRAEQQRQVAEEQRGVAEAQREQADRILEGATTIIVDLQHQMNEDTKRKVFALFRTGAEHGDATSMANLGTIYLDGVGVAQDYAKAREWLEKAVDKGNMRAMGKLAVLYDMTDDYAKAREWAEKAADKGDTSAMIYLAVVYQGGRGVAQDDAKAREWYEKAADKGNASAMMLLGLLYEHREGDYAKAREWYEKAADKGYAEAKANLEKLAVREAVRAGRYADALQLQEALAARVEAEEREREAARVEADERKREGKPGQKTAQELIMVTWYALLAREFTKALTVADRAHSLLPDNTNILTIESIRAHALLFLGYREESTALYLAHKGKPIPGRQDGKLWERAIAEDFAYFRKAGLTRPMMADIERELGVSQ
jgi:TPR repeat protein